MVVKKNSSRDRSLNLVEISLFLEFLGTAMIFFLYIILKLGINSGKMIGLFLLWSTPILSIFAISLSFKRVGGTSKQERVYKTISGLLGILVMVVWTIIVGSLMVGIA